MLTQARSKRKVSGARYKKARKKRAYEVARIPSLTKLDKTRLSRINVLGHHQKMRLLSSDTANVVDPKTKKSQVVKIKTILENPAFSSTLSSTTASAFTSSVLGDSSTSVFTSVSDNAFTHFEGFKNH